MMWIRNFTIDKQKLGDRLIIHGHTPIPLDEVLNPARDNVFNIDGGCVYRDRPGQGHLVALNLNDLEWFVVQNCE